ncbi:MAG: PAS domain S-box protein [Flavobacteriaceae bacterium]
MGKLKVLILEDNELDVELIKEELIQHKLAFISKHVETQEDFTKALLDFKPEMILSDYNLPQFTGYEALKIAVKISPEIPFILVTGNLSEEIAVESIKSGAWDYVLKDNLLRLTPAIHNALKLKVEKDINRQNHKELLKLSTAIDQSPVSIVITDLKGDIEFVNPRFEEITGYTQKEVIGKNPRVLKSGDQPKEYYTNLWKIISSGKVWKGEFHNKTKDGKLFWERVTIKPIKDDDGKTTNYLALKEDITQEKISKDALRIAYKKLENKNTGLTLLSGELTEKNRLLIDSKNRFREIFDKSPIPIWEEDFSEVIKLLNKKKSETKDLRAYLEETPFFIKKCVTSIKILRVSEVTYGIFGVKNIPELVKLLRKSNTKKSLNVLKEELLSIASGKKEFTGETEFLSESGEVITAIIKSVIDKEGRAIVSLNDITTLKKVEKNLKESQFSLLKSQEIANIGSYKLDLVTGNWTLTLTLEKIFGIDDDYDKSVGGWLGIVHEDDRELMKNYIFDDILLQRKKFDKEYRIKRINDKEERWLYSVGELEFNDAGVPIKMVGTTQDITRRKISEQELLKSKEATEESERSFRELYEKSGDAILIIKNGEFIACNEATLKMLKCKTTEIFLNTHPSKISPELQPNGEPSFKEAEKMMKLSLKKGTHRFEWIHTRRDGEEFPVEVLLTAISNKPGNQIIHCVWRDITERKEIEKELISSKEKAEESNRLKTEFLHNMSHEIRTPMNGILGFTQLLDDAYLTDKKRTHFVNIIQNSGRELLHIIDDILEISKLETKQVSVVESEVCINDTFFELFSIFDLKAKEQGISLYFKKGLLDAESTIYTDKVKLNKILSNLLENALKFTTRGYVAFGYNLKKNNTLLEIYVKDTGIGIEPEKQKIIFERFSQAEKKISRKAGGLGLGLSIAKENAELLDGEISVESKMMDGATFTVTIPYKPVVKKNAVKKEKGSLKKEIQKCTILIAEDEEVNFLFLEILLVDKLRVPCKILHAIDGEEAVEMCKDNPNIDLVLMDIKMPKLNGYEATKEIKKIRPELPIVAQTAYSTREDMKKATDAGCVEFITKPINKDILNKIIGKYLRKNG